MAGMKRVTALVVVGPSMGRNPDALSRLSAVSYLESELRNIARICAWGTSAGKPSGEGLKGTYAFAFFKRVCRPGKVQHFVFVASARMADFLVSVIKFVGDMMGPSLPRGARFCKCIAVKMRCVLTWEADPKYWMPAVNSASPLDHGMAASPVAKAVNVSAYLRTSLRHRLRLSVAQTSGFRTGYALVAMTNE